MNMMNNLEVCAWLIILLAYIFGTWTIISTLKDFIRYMFWLFFTQEDDDEEN